MAKQKGMPEKKGLKDCIIYIVIAVLLLIVGLWGGYVLQETADRSGEINFQKALNNMGEYMTAESLISAAESAMSDGQTAKKGAMYGGMTGLLILAYQISKTPKRFHRKGEEHGSARWGTDAEKKTLGDVNNFYNNAILAADVFLVLDRKKRDEAAAEIKEKSTLKYKLKKLLSKLKKREGGNGK